MTARAAYELMAGLFRIRCLNSLVAQIATMDSIKVRHSGDALEKVVDGTYRVLKQAEAVLAAPRDWSRIALDDDAKAALAASAHALRFGDADGKVTTPIRPEQLLTPRRADDRANDLWTVMNVIQENVMRGGLSARAPATIDQHGRWRRGRVVTTRAINNIDQDVRLNRALWVLGDAWRARSDGPRSSARCRAARRRAGDRKPEHRTTAWDPSAGPFSLPRPHTSNLNRTRPPRGRQP